MRFIINGVIVYFDRLLFVNKDGHILQLLLADGVDTDVVHTILVKVLKKSEVGVMDKSERNEDGQSEIRILQGLELPVIDQIRIAGMSVEQIPNLG